ncbi:cytochrome P450 [Stipitochalara longipes BDJ]|nr:cytochrome P450 [Stipitochalara longipes BDJ]
MEVATATAVAVAVAAQLYISPIPEVSTIKVLLTYFSANTALLLYLFTTTSDILYSFSKLTILNFAFLSTATALTLFRRLYFSPLSSFPGPKLAAVSNFYKANVYRTGRGAKAFLKLHEKYNSDIVRIGPNELSIRNVDAVDKIYKGKYPRGTFYEVGAINGAYNLNTQRNYEIHTPWRRIWEKAFVSAEFEDYNPRVEHHVSKLTEVIRKTEGKEVNATKLLENLVFDIMADLSFAHDAGMQDGKGDNEYMDFTHKYMWAVGVIAALRPLCQLLPLLPEASDVRDFRLRGEALLAKRQKLGTSRKDIFRHLLYPDSITSNSFTQTDLNSNANLIIVAGSDTTTTAMTQIFRMLAKDKRVLKKLQDEVDGTYGEWKELSIQKATKMSYLNAVVNEGLRLCNPLPTGAYAGTYPQGVEVAGKFVPGNVQITIPHLALMTDERYFTKGWDFIPERWTGEWSEGVKERRAFIPFGYGAHSCVGKQLALNEMRLTIARVVGEFDIALGDSYDEKTWEDEWKDHAVLQVGKLWVHFVPRVR